MGDRCPYFEYRQLEGTDTETPRGYCNAAEQFVQPMRADICNGRYGLFHETDCEIYQAHAGDDDDV